MRRANRGGTGGLATRDGAPADRPPAGRGRDGGGRAALTGLTNLARELTHKLRGGELGSLPAFGCLIVLWVLFQALDHQFLSPRNLSSLSVDIVGTGMIAVGIVFVLLLGEIDLSVAAVSGLTAAIFAVLNVIHGVPEWLAILAALLAGAAIGSVHGYFFARVGVPAFVVTLAGLLAWSGLMLYVLGVNGTINLPSQGAVTALTDVYFTDPAIAYALAALAAAWCFLTSWYDARRRRAAGVPFRPLSEVAVRAAAVAAIGFGAAYMLNQFQGLPLALLIFLAFVFGLDLLLRRSPYGRMVFAIGGGVEAARRSGVSVVWVRISAFAASGTLAAVGGLFLASRVASAGQTAGSPDLLINAIAAAVIGGVSLFGGRGRTWSALLGVLIVQSIASGMILLNIQGAVEHMVIGGVLLAAVVLDSLTRRSQRAHGRA